MTGQQICLKWNSFQANILTSFETLWEEEGLVDVTLASDGECIRAHRIILSACSPFFKRLFQSNPCQHPVIILQDVHFSELEALLSFVYKGEVNIDQENLPALLRAAETLQIRGLSGASEQLKGKMGVPKNSSSAPSCRSSLDGSPPYKRRRSDHQPPRSPAPPTTPAATMPTTVSEHTRHPPSSSADSGEQLQQHKLERRSSDSNSPVPPLLSVEEGFEESVDGSLDLKAVHVADTEQLKEITIGLENENILQVGAAFSTFKEFEAAYNAWADAGHHPMSKSKTKRNMNPLQPDHPYVNVDYVCKHHGEPRSRGKNIRPNQRYFSRGCPVKVKVNLNLRPMKYIVRQVVADHNHVVSAELRAQYPDRRMLLDTSTEETITQLVGDNVKPKEITTFLTDNLGKTLYAKDIHNMKKRRFTKPKHRILAEVAYSPLEENVACPNVPDGCFMEDDGQNINEVTTEVESVPIGSVSHVKDKDKQLKAPVIYVTKRRNASSASLVQVQGEDVPVKVVPVSQVNLPVIHVKRNDGQLNIPSSQVRKIIMVRTKPKNVVLIQPPID